MRTDGQREATKLILAFHNSAKSPQNGCTPARAWFHARRINLGINFHRDLSNLLFVQAAESCSGLLLAVLLLLVLYVLIPCNYFYKLFSDAARGSVIKIVQQLVNNELERV